MPLNPSDESLEVLLVDDELSTREILEQFCRSRNLAVTVASDGRAAITALERNPSRFTMVLTDINMPGADGFEVLKAARAANRSCYVVMITGYATLDSALRAVREGAYDYLAKPFSLGQLDVMMARIKDRIALERENRDLRRRLQGVKGGAGATGSASSALQSSVLPSQPASAPATYPTPAAARPQPAAAASPAAAVDQRVATMEERLARMEELLRAAIGSGAR
jgi:DNA-binding NtrC family response regulator